MANNLIKWAEGRDRVRKAIHDASHRFQHYNDRLKFVDRMKKAGEAMKAEHNKDNQ